MGLVQYFGSKFYEPIDSGKPACLGQLTWIPVPQLQSHPFVIEAERQADTSHGLARARWVTMNDTHFTRRDLKNLPILSFKLNETEEMIAYKAKRRPGVIVGAGATLFKRLPSMPAHHEENRLVAAPIYGIRDEDDLSGFSPVMAARVRHLLYKQYFPAASWSETRRSTNTAGACSLKEGVIRFDRLQFVSPSPPGCKLVPLKLSSDVLALAHATLWAYLHAEPSKTLTEMRELLVDLLPEEAQPN